MVVSRRMSDVVYTAFLFGLIKRTLGVWNVRQGMLLLAGTNLSA